MAGRQQAARAIKIERERNGSKSKSEREVESARGFEAWLPFSLLCHVHRRMQWVVSLGGFGRTRSGPPQVSFLYIKEVKEKVCVGHNLCV
jgi:hypothetical protein